VSVHVLTCVLCFSFFRHAEHELLQGEQGVSPTSLLYSFASSQRVSVCVSPSLSAQVGNDKLENADQLIAEDIDKFSDCLVEV